MLIGVSKVYIPVFVFHMFWWLKGGYTGTLESYFFHACGITVFGVVHEGPPLLLAAWLQHNIVDSDTFCVRRWANGQSFRYNDR